MKILSIAAAGVAVALIALTLVTAAGEYRLYFALAGLVAAVTVLVTIGVGWREQRPEAPPPLRRPDAAPTTIANAGAAEVVGFLALLQEQGRFVDFLQDDITGYSDAQVGAAARVVHQGCKTALQEYVRIVPVRDEPEGGKVTVPAGYAADEYRLVGKIAGQGPFSGTLMHRGWKADEVHLPRILRIDVDRLPTIAPAEVELR